MATIYILYSESIDQFYIGSCLDLTERLEQHLNKSFEVGFTHRANDWKLFYSIEDLEYGIARKIEQHIKKMKSRKYLENLKTHPEIIDKLIERSLSGSTFYRTSNPECLGIWDFSFGIIPHCFQKAQNPFSSK